MISSARANDLYQLAQVIPGRVAGWPMPSLAKLGWTTTALALEDQAWNDEQDKTEGKPPTHKGPSHPSNPARAAAARARGRKVTR